MISEHTKMTIPIKIKRQRRRKVVIEVHGGVAYITKKPHDVDVQIIDRDNEKVGN